MVCGPKWPFYSWIVILDCLGQVCSWVELPIQRRLCPIFMRDVGSPDIHECFRGLTGSQRTPGFWGVRGFQRGKKQSCSPRQGLHVGTSFVEFRQLREVEVFSYLVYFQFKSLVNGLVDVRPRVAVWSVPKLGTKILEIWDCFGQSRDRFTDYY